MWEQPVWSNQSWISFSLRTFGLSHSEPFALWLPLELCWKCILFDVREQTGESQWLTQPDTFTPSWKCLRLPVLGSAPLCHLGTKWTYLLTLALRATLTWGGYGSLSTWGNVWGTDDGQYGDVWWPVKGLCAPNAIPTNLSECFPFSPESSGIKALIKMQICLLSHQPSVLLAIVIL